MANSGVLSAAMPGLWREGAFWGFFSPHDPALAEEKAQSELRRCGFTHIRISNRQYLSYLRSVVSENYLDALFKREFLENPDDYPDILCVLKTSEPDVVTTLFNYTVDERMVNALGEIFPDREITCDWFIDGMGDYGSFVLKNREVVSETSGNLQEDLSKDKSAPVGC